MTDQILAMLFLAAAPFVALPLLLGVREIELRSERRRAAGTPAE